MADDDKGSAIPEYSSKWWMKEIETTEKHLDDKWRRAADNVVNRYLDERSGDNGQVSGVSSDDTLVKKYNIFWANVQIMKSALYATPPKPTIKRQHDDPNDDVARTAAMILERIIKFGFTDQDGDMHEALQMAMEDYLIPGLGQIWQRYSVETEPIDIPAVTDPATGQVITEAQKGSKIVDEGCPTDYVHWRDFLYSVTRTWNEKWWVGRRCWMKKRAFIKRFSQEQWDEVKNNSVEGTRKDPNMPKGFTKHRAEVFEIWCEESNKVYWVNRHLDDNLDEKEDPLQLENFYPCPKPVLSTHTTNSFIPRSDYTMVADQYDELDTLNARIGILTRALRVVGVYDADNKELKQLLSGGEFNMVGVSNWASFAEKQGLKGSVDWFPVEVIAEVLEKLMMQRQAVIQQIYELTSISDIQRGSSNPRETLGAQKLKAQFSSVRLQLRQQEVAKFVREAVRIKCEIICNHWQPDTIKRVSQIELTESAQYADAAIQLLKSREDFEFRVEIGEETLSLADYNAERELRTQVLTAIGQFLSQASQMIEVYPTVMPQMFKMIQWVVASFRGSGDMEAVLDEAMRLAQTNPPPPKDDGKAGAQAAEAAKVQMHQATEQTKLQMHNASEANKKYIAELSSNTTKAVAEMNNGTKILLEQMANAMTKQAEDNKASQESMRIGMEQMSQRAQMAHEAIMQFMSGQQEKEGGQSDELKSIMKELTSTMSKKRVRVPKYNKAGEIESVEESIGD